MSHLRWLRRHPWFAAAVISILSLSIGACAGIFALLDSILLRPLPYPKAGQLVEIDETSEKNAGSIGLLSPPQLEEVRQQSKRLVEVAGYYTESISETSGEMPLRVQRAVIGAGFFRLVGVPMLMGRAFVPEEEQANGPGVVVISERLWRNRFASAPDIIGRMQRQGRSSFRIVGVAPSSLEVMADVDLFQPAQFPPALANSRYARFLTTVARLSEGATAESARAELQSIRDRGMQQYQQDEKGWRVRVQPLKEARVGDSRRVAALLGAATALLLIIACSNVAGLLLIRMAGREREMATRLALGSSRSGLWMQLLREGLYLSVPATLLGMLLSAAASEWLERWSATMPRLGSVQMDYRVALVAALSGIITTMLFSLTPAWLAARKGAMGALGRQGASLAGRGLLPRLLAAMQVAVSVLLISGAGLLLVALQSTLNVERGLRAEHVAAFRITASWGESNDIPAVNTRHQRTLDALRRQPGLSHAAISTSLPGDASARSARYDLAAGGDPVPALARGVSADYFAVMGMSAMSGELCRADESTYVVNRSFVRRYGQEQTPTGQMLRINGLPEALPISAVVSDARERELSREPEPTVYRCGPHGFVPDLWFVVRMRGDAPQLETMIRNVVREVSPARAVYDYTTLADAMQKPLEPLRIQTTLLGGFALVALLLTIAGIYSVVSMAVRAQWRELGLRMTLGATPLTLGRFVFLHSWMVLAAGALLGTAIAFPLSQMMARQLGLLEGNGVWWITAAACGLSVLVAAAAVWLPARRAMAAQPALLLRQE
jgi:putative ABC transport system permease protein